MTNILGPTDPANNINIFEYEEDFTEDIKVWTQEIPKYTEIQPRIAILDIETRDLNIHAQNAHILAIEVTLNNQRFVWDLGFNPDGSFYENLYVRQKVMLTSFINWLNDADIFILSGHNIFSFDIPYIMEQCKQAGIHTGFVLKPGWRGRKSEVKNSNVHGRVIEFENIEHRNFNIVDTFHLCGIADKMQASLQEFGLKFVCGPDGYNLRGDRVDIPGDKINETFHNDHDKFLAYLGDDCKDTRLLIDFLLPSLWYLLVYIPDMNLQSLIFAGNGQLWNGILYKHYGYKPEADRKVSYSGGFTGVKSGVFPKCKKMDVSSLYPSIQLAKRICSKKDVDQYQLKVLSLIKRLRLELKEKGNNGDKDSEYQSLSLKIIINSGYGFLGTIGINFNDIEAADLITTTGRKVLAHMIEYCRYNGANIVQADTDGIILQHENLDGLHAALQRDSPKWVDIDLEASYDWVWIYKRKNYLTCINGKIKAVGLLRKRGKCELYRRFLKHLPVVYLEHEIEGCRKFKDSIVQALKNHEIPLELLIESKKITNYKDPNVNDKIATALKAEPGDYVKYFRYDKIEEYITPKKKEKKTRKVYGYCRANDTTHTYSADYYINEIIKFKKGKTRDKNKEGWYYSFENSIVDPINETSSGEEL